MHKHMFQVRDVTAFGTVSLGALIDSLHGLESDGDGGHRYAFFDFGGLVPYYMDSYRGYYDHLAITFHDGNAITVGQLLEKLRAADGATFSGYKGGSFPMDRRTPVWVANHGECDSTAIVGICIESSRVTILTEYRP